MPLSLGKIDNITQKEWIVFWRIIFEVQRVRKPVVRKEVSLWEKIGKNKQKRIGKKIENLEIMSSTNVSYEYDTELKQYKAIFSDGYIECKDIPLQDTLDKITDEIGQEYQLDEIVVSESYLGENITIHATVKLETPPKTGTHPLFYYPQPHGFIGFSEDVDAGGNHNINWSIANTNNHRHGKSPHSFTGVNGWHNLQIRQDRDVDNKNKFYYEYLIDGFPLDRRVTNPNEAEIQFDQGPNIFYIGRTPQKFDTPNQSKYVNLTGEISHLVFDPNDTCWTC